MRLSTAVGGHDTAKSGSGNMAEGSYCTRSEPIVIISSDEDDEEDVQDLFNAFVSHVERYIEQSDVVLLLKLKFAEARPEFVSSAKFKCALKWRTTQMNKANGYIYTGDICKLLLEDLKRDDSKVKLDGVKEDVDRDACSAGNESVVIPTSRAEPDVDKRIIHVTIDNCERDDSNNVVKGMPAEFTNPQPSTSKAKPSTSLEVKGENKKKGKLHAATITTESSPQKKLLTPRKQKQLKKLKLKLDYLSDQIKILSRAELSLEEMDMSASTYIQECRLKERFTRIYNKICKLQGHPPVTGRVTERELKCPTTSVPEIDRAVNKFLKEKKSRFPDIFDIRNVVFEANKQHGLKLSVQALNEISDEVFMCVGNKLQKRRKRDFENNFGCSLTDHYQPSNDPAIADLVLRKKLEENKKISKRNLDDIFKKFTHYGRMAAYDDGSSSSDNDSENSKPQNGHVKSAMKRKFSHISMAQSSDSSENECNDFGLQKNMNDDNILNGNDQVFDDRSTSKNHFEGKSKKKRMILKFSDTTENDLEDFDIKTTQQEIERKENADSNTTCETNNNIAFPSKETNLSVAELPNSTCTRSECSSVECTAVVELDCSLQHTEVETTRQASSSEVDDVASVSEDHQIIPEEDTSRNVVSSSPQSSEAWTDSNVLTLSKEDLISQSSELSVPSLQSQSNPNDYVTTADNSDVKLGVLSDSSNVIDSKVVAEETPRENGRRKTLLNSISAKKSVDKNFLSSISIPLTPVSLKGQKSLLHLSSRKRKAESRSLEYESPHRIVCDARLYITEQKQEASLNGEESTGQRSICKRKLTLAESDNLLSAAISDSPPLQATTNSQSTEGKGASRRLALSLNKGGRNSPSSKQKVVERTDVIVLSDDDSDS